MSDEPKLSEDGKRRRREILQAAIEEGGRLRKRRNVIRRAGACAVVALVLLGAALISQRSARERSVVRDDDKFVERILEAEDHAYSSARVEMVSSDSVSIEEYIVRTVDVSSNAVMLDDNELMEAIEDTDFGIAQVGKSTWLSRDGGTMKRIN